jgi:small subunit ribosomal protein S24e
MKILEQKENFLLKRKEVLARLEAEKTPSFEEAKENLAKETKADKEVIVIKKVNGGYGLKDFRVRAFIYASKEDLARTEKKPKAKKSAGAAPEAVQAAPADKK